MKRKKFIILALVLLIVAFIIGNSLLPRPQSRDLSKLVLEWVRPGLELFVGKGNVTLNLVRKIAHVVEYTALGLVLGLLFRKKRYWYVWAAGLGLALAAADETVQIFTGRGPAVRDVLIDFGGVLLGLLLCLLIRTICRKRQRP